MVHQRQETMSYVVIVADIVSDEVQVDITCESNSVCFHL